MKKLFKKVLKYILEKNILIVEYATINSTKQYNLNDIHRIEKILNQEGNDENRIISLTKDKHYLINYNKLLDDKLLNLKIKILSI